MFRPLALALLLPAALAAQEAPPAGRPDPLADPDAFLVGHWVWDEASFEDRIGPTESDLAIDYRADGTFEMAGTVVMQLDGEPWPVEVLSEGTWQAMANEAGHILITFNARNTVTTPDTGTTIEQVVRTETYEVGGEDRLIDASSGETMIRS